MCRLPDCDNQADHSESEDELDYNEPNEDLEYQTLILLTKYAINYLLILCFHTNYALFLESYNNFIAIINFISQADHPECKDELDYEEPDEDLKY